MRYLIPVLVVMGFAHAASAQQTIINNNPPFNGGAALYAPQVSVVSSGVLNDVEGTVSADRKYVTLTMRPQNSNIISFQTFNFGTGVATPGFAGGAGAPQNGAAGGANNANGANNVPQPGVLAAPGMQRMGGL